jgi:hypothetical protein
MGKFLGIFGFISFLLYYFSTWIFMYQAFFLDISKIFLVASIILIIFAFIKWANQHVVSKIFVIINILILTLFILLMSLNF